jgi:serine/threonine protein kinase
VTAILNCFMPWTRGSLLGEGGYGRVFECLNDDGHICAAKVVPLRPGDDDRSRAAQAEIEKEVDVMRKLSHPNIVRYIGTERDDKELVIFLELVPGGSISGMLGKYGKFKESVVRGYCREILQGLEYLHANKILHRDIKGPNILVDFSGVCKLSDFGCSKELYGGSPSCAHFLSLARFGHERRSELAVHAENAENALVLSLARVSALTHAHTQGKSHQR